MNKGLKSRVLIQSVLSDDWMSELAKKRGAVFARLRAIGVEVRSDTHDATTLVIPEGKEAEAYIIYKELLPSGEPGILDKLPLCSEREDISG